MRTLIPFILSCIIAGMTPLVQPSHDISSNGPTFPGWPTHYQGHPLVELPLRPEEKRFAKRFPGMIGRFQAGSKTLVIRWLHTSTRLLHPAKDCYQGLGYTIGPPEIKHSNSQLYRIFEAQRGGELLTVREWIENEKGRSWSDISTWYWSALLGSDKGPWWAFTVTTSNLN